MFALLSRGWVMLILLASDQGREPKMIDGPVVDPDQQLHAYANAYQAQKEQIESLKFRIGEIVEELDQITVSMDSRRLDSLVARLRALSS